MKGSIAKYSLIIAVILLTISIAKYNSFATGLSDIITTLYGGNGVPVTSTFEKERPTGGVDVVKTVFIPLDSSIEIQDLNSELNSEKGSFPVSSTGGGFTFQYDSELEVFTRTTDSLGPIFAERAITLGRGKINFGFSYTYINYSSIQGEDLDNIESTVLLDEEQKDTNLLKMDFDVNIKTNLFSFYGTYGITDNWDFSILIPIMQVQLDVDSTATILNRTTEKSEEGNTLGYSLDSGDTIRDSVSGASTGIGDILLRSKYSLFKSTWIDFSPAIDIKLQTGDDDNLLGTGRTSIKPFFIISKNIGRLTPHTNIGYEFNSGSEGWDRIVYIAGTDYGFGKGNNHFSVALDIVGSHKMEKSETGNDIIDYSTGFKWSPRMGMLVFANVQIPVNEDGLRADWVPTVGYELNF